MLYRKKKDTYIRNYDGVGYITSTGKPRLTAEIIYRFISKEYDFEEEHKGLDYVMIEKEILAYCYRKHKSFEPRLWAD